MPEQAYNHITIKKNNITSFSNYKNNLNISKESSFNNGGNGGGSNMEERIVRLETKVDNIDNRLSNHDIQFERMNGILDRVNDKLTNIENKIEKLPTNDSVNTAILSVKVWALSGVIGGMIAVSGILITILKIINSIH